VIKQLKQMINASETVSYKLPVVNQLRHK